MGGGWNVLFAPGRPVHTAVAAVIAVPWDQTNVRHNLSLDLLNADGHAIEIEGQPVRIQGEFEVGRPPGIKPGSALNTPLVWNFDGLVVDACSYEWKLAVDVAPTPGRPLGAA